MNSRTVNSGAAGAGPAVSSTVGAGMADSGAADPGTAGAFDADAAGPRTADAASARTGAPYDTAPALTADRTVHRRLVHKRAVEQVLTTAVAKTGGRLLGTAQLPRLHRHYNDTCAPYYDLLLIGEAARQTVEAIVHELLGVPLDARFVISDLGIALTGLDAVRTGPAPADLHVELEPGRLRRRRDGSVRSLRGSAACRIGSREAARFTGTLLFLAGESYEDLRAGSATSPPADARTAPPRCHPSAVGRTDPRNVVIGGLRTERLEGGEKPGESETVADIVADPQDPVFYDHALDHLPGMLLMEAARQTALAAWARTRAVPAGALLATACRARFLAFAEQSASVRCRARPTGTAVTGTVAVTVEQRGEPVAELEITVESVPEADRPGREARAPTPTAPPGGAR
ncbi:AfsA-related hotdog domain-containing protein [Streptomyces roseoverticillatus]|uniref:AfsA-related hotdog domain-containing protein n=1 Tax=Streptomyces roseoverticillatus TaxID=66429 RepID=UPI0004C26F45|nr:AfsA-related hotdog domain-containing protein [Streptomyces roseoverticillatus]